MTAQRSTLGATEITATGNFPRVSDKKPQKHKKNQRVKFLVLQNLIKVKALLG